jgi:hypothetical protein
VPQLLIELPADSPLTTRLLVHYTNKSRSLKTEAQWSKTNDIDIRFYDDSACLQLVQQHRPHFVQTYQNELSIVERADYFRYLAVWAYGGLYVDSDVNFTKPVDKWLDTYGWDTEQQGARLLSTVDLVVGVEFPRPQTGYNSTGWLPLQINQFIFAGAKGSAIMKRIIDHIEVCITTIPRDGNVEMTLERTGPAAFTRAIITEIETRGLSSSGQREVVTESMSDERHPRELLPLHQLEKMAS